MNQSTDDSRHELEQNLRNLKIEAAQVAENGSKFAGTMTVDFGSMDIGHFSVQIPMFFPEPKPNLQHLEAAEEVLRAMAVDAKMWIPKDKLFGPHNIIRSSLMTAAMYADPGRDCRSQDIMVPAACALSVYYLDDEVCGELEFNTVVETNELMSNWTDVLMTIFEGKYSTFDAVPPVPATVACIIRLFFFLSSKYGHLMPPGTESKNLRAAFEHFATSTIALRIPAVSRTVSGHLFRRIRGHDLGHSVLVEIAAVGVGVGAVLDVDQNQPLLAPSVRAHTFFRLLMDLVRLEAGLTHDLIGIGKALTAHAHEHEAFNNHVIRAVKLEGMSYAEAFAASAALIKNTRTDIGLLADQLVEEFPENGGLAAMIVVIKRLLDANAVVQAHVIAPKYGPVSVTVSASATDGQIPTPIRANF